jgi:hypothetical protein
VLDEFVFSGPTNKPQLYDSKFIVPIYEKQQKLKEIVQESRTIRKNFEKNVFDKFSRDKFHKMKELLFIWFCSEPKKVLQAIKEVQAKAAEEGSASYKALNVTLTSKPDTLIASNNKKKELESIKEVEEASESYKGRSYK